MSSPKISIIVPIYKVEEEIHKCIESILKQTFQDIEIVLIDDGSPDKCPQICDEYAKKDNRVRVIHKENGGLSDARNFGLLEAIGEYVLFVDSDDYIDRSTCEKFYNSIEETVDIITGEALRIERKNQQLMSYAEIFPELILSGREFLKLQLKSKRMYMAVWMNLYNRKFLINKSLFFKKGILHEDEHWTPRVFLMAEKVKQIKYPFYNYVIRANSITKKKNTTQNGIDLINICYELESIYEKLDDIELKKYLNDYLVMLFLHAINYGNLYASEFNDLYSKKFIIGKILSPLNRFKGYLFITNKRLYKFLNSIHKLEIKKLEDGD